LRRNGVQWQNACAPFPHWRVELKKLFALATLFLIICMGCGGGRAPGAAPTPPTPIAGAWNFAWPNTLVGSGANFGYLSASGRLQQTGNKVSGSLTFFTTNNAAICSSSGPHALTGTVAACAPGICTDVAEDEQVSFSVDTGCNIFAPNDGSTTINFSGTYQYTSGSSMQGPGGSWTANWTGP